MRESSPGSPKEQLLSALPRAARAARCRIPEPQHRQPGGAHPGHHAMHRQLPVYLEGKGSGCGYLSSSLTPAKQFPSPQVAPNLSLWAGAGSEYPAGHQDPVPVRLVLGVRTKAPCVIWFFSAWRQQNEMGFPDLSGRSHLLTLADGSWHAKGNHVLLPAARRLRLCVCYWQLTDGKAVSRDMEKSSPEPLSFQSEGASTY